MDSYHFHQHHQIPKKTTGLGFGSKKSAKVFFSEFNS